MYPQIDDFLDSFVFYVKSEFIIEQFFSVLAIVEISVLGGKICIMCP